MMNNHTFNQPSVSSASSHHHHLPVAADAAASASPSIAHMRSIAAAAAKEGGPSNGGCLVPTTTNHYPTHINNMVLMGSGGDGCGVHRPRPQRGFLPSSISKSICTLAMKMVGDDTIRARVADLIPDDFLMVDEDVGSSSSSITSPPLVVRDRAGVGGAFDFANTPATTTDNPPPTLLNPQDLVNNSSSSSHNNPFRSTTTPPDISPPFDDNDDDSYSEWIAILTPSTTDGGLAQFPSSPTPTTTIVNTANNTHKPTTIAQDSSSLIFVEGQEEVEEGPQPPSVASSPSPRRVHLRRNVSSLLELNFSLRASPLTHHNHNINQPHQLGQNTCEGQEGAEGAHTATHMKEIQPQHPPPQQRVLSMAVSPPTRLGGSVGVVLTRSQSPASDSTSSSSSCDPDLLTSRPHSPTTTTTSSDSDDDDGDTTPPRTPPLHSHLTPSPLNKGNGNISSDNVNPPTTTASSSEIGSWFESLFNVVLRSVTNENRDDNSRTPDVTPSSSSPLKVREGTAPNAEENATINKDDSANPRGATNGNMTTASSPLPYFPPNTPTNLLERQFIIAAAYVLNAALIAGVKSADYILGQQQQCHHHRLTHQSQQGGGVDDNDDSIQSDGGHRQGGGSAAAGTAGAGLSISAARLKANRIIQNFVEAAVDVIQHAWFTTHNY